jgi:hypothetical protein
MRNLFCFTTGWSLLVLLMLSVNPAQRTAAQTNLLSNGSFEVSPDGTVLPDSSTSRDWRMVAGVVGGVATATVRTAAASAGAVGMEIAHTSGASWFDRWDTYAPCQNRPGVYMALVDAKNGGIYGSQDNFLLDMVVHNNNATYPEFVTSCVPGANFETFGMLAPVTSIADGIDLRLTPSATANQSFFADNAKVYDVTLSNRTLNPGFENSSSRLINWRTFGTAGEFNATLSNDAHNGSKALQIERISGTGDAAVDQFADRVPLIPGERMEFSFYAKKLSGDAATRLCVFVAEYDSAGTFTGNQTNRWFNVTGSYGHYTGQLTVGATTASGCIAFRVGDDASGVNHVGAYAIDDVSFKRIDNLITGGDYEGMAEGDDAPSLWREPWTTVNMITKAAGASEGRMGAEIDTTTPAGEFIDRWLPANLTAPVTRPGIYKVLIDAKDGGINGGQDSFALGAVMHDSPYPTWSASCEPGADFETFGVTAPMAADRTAIDVRLTPSNTANQSFLIDNVQILDVTKGNRMINGGFEYSTTRPVNWRTYSLAAGEFLYSISTDANSGTGALRIERTAMANDGAVDLENNRIAVMAGETLQIKLAAKKLSGDSQTRLFVSIAQYDSAGTYLGGALQTNVAFDATASYSPFGVAVTMDAAAAYINIGLRVGNDAGGDRHVGAYLVDDLTVMRNQAPSFTGASLQYHAFTSDETSIEVVTAGWLDNDSDAAQYRYQWKLNNVPISGATGPVLDKTVYGSTGSVTCLVTAFDGISTGNTIETAPLLVPVTVSSFSAE